MCFTRLPGAEDLVGLKAGSQYALGSEGVTAVAALNRLLITPVLARGQCALKISVMVLLSLTNYTKSFSFVRKT